MAEAYSLSVWPSSLALESELSRNLESHTGLVPRLSHHGGKNIAYAEKQLFGTKTNHSPECNPYASDEQKNS